MSSAADSRGIRRRQERVTQACARCKEKKVRCDGKTPACSSCAKVSAECSYAETQRRRGPGKSKRYIETLENRLSKMATAFHQAGLSHPNSLAEDDESGLPDASSAVSEESPPKGTAIFDAIEKRMARIRAGTDLGCFKQQVFSPDHTASGNHMFIMPVFDDIFSGYSLLQWPSFESKILYSSILEDPAWFACLNATLALTTRQRAIPSAISELYPIAWAQFKNAFSVLPQLLVQGRDISAVESILAMAVFVRGTADTQTLAMLISSAARLYQFVSLDNTSTTEQAKNADMERQERVFWTMCSLDTEMSLGYGLPPVAGSNYLDSKLPVQNIAKNTAQRLIQLDADLSILKVRIHTVFDAVKAPQTRRLPVQEIIQIQSDLGNWAAKSAPGISIDFAAQVVNLKSSRKNEALRLCLEYLSCEQMFHWVIFKERHSEEMRAYISQGLQWDGALSRRKYQTAAHLTMLQLDHISILSYTPMWSVMCYPLASHILLLGSILELPTNQNVISLLSDMASFVRFLKKMVGYEGYDLRQMLVGCSRMESIARNTVEEARTALLSRKAYTPSTQAQNALLAIIIESAHPLSLAHSLMSNYSKKASEIMMAFCKELNIPWTMDQRYGPFVPEWLIPENYNFVFK